jgi:hypothetical protein
MEFYSADIEMFMFGWNTLYFSAPGTGCYTNKGNTPRMYHNALVGLDSSTETIN